MSSLLPTNTHVESEKPKPPKYGRLFAAHSSKLWWILSTLAAEVAFLLLSETLIIVDSSLGMAALGILTGGIAGLIGGMGQRLALRNKVPSAKGWVWATALGWTLKGATIYPLFNVLYSTSESIFGSRSDFSTGYLDELVIYAIVGLITGLEIGLGQWLVLRSLTGRAWIWPIVSALAYLLGFALSSALAHTIAPILAGAIHDFTILQISLAGGIAGIVTYISLANYLAWANE